MSEEGKIWLRSFTKSNNDSFKAMLTAPGQDGIAKAVANGYSLERMNNVVFDTPRSLEDCNAIWSTCTSCHLRCQTQFILRYKGAKDALGVVLFDSPEGEDSAKGEILSGRSGKLLRNILANAKLDRTKLGQLGWLSTTGCASNPSEDKVGYLACSDRLYAYLAAVRPRYILCMGERAANYFFSSEELKTKQRNVWYRVQDAKGEWVLVCHAIGFRELAKFIAVLLASHTDYVAIQRIFGELVEAVEQKKDTRPETWPFVPHYVTEITHDKLPIEAEARLSQWNALPT